MTGRDGGEEGAIPFVVVGVIALGGVLGAAWAGHEWSQQLLGEAGGELTVWVLRGAFWALDLVAAQAAATPIDRDWYTPVLDGPALPLYALAGLVMVATLLAEVVSGIAQGNTVRIVQAAGRALVAGMLATIAATILLSVGGALSGLGRAALAASGTTVDAPLIPLQQVLMDTAEARADAGVELFIAFLAAVVIVFTCLAIYFILAMRPVVLAAIIVLLPVAHALSVWAPLRRVQIRVWSLAIAVLLADAAILTMFAVANVATDQPQGVDRLIFGTFGLLLAALAPAALARIVGAPELHAAVTSMSRGTKALTAGAGLLALNATRNATRTATGSGGGGGSALETAVPTSAATGGGGGGPAAGGPSAGGPAAGPSGSGSGGGDSSAGAAGNGSGASPSGGAVRANGGSRTAGVEGAASSAARTGAANGAASGNGSPSAAAARSAGGSSPSATTMGAGGTAEAGRVPAAAAAGADVAATSLHSSAETGGPASHQPSAGGTNRPATTAEPSTATAADTSPSVPVGAAEPRAAATPAPGAEPGSATSVGVQATSAPSMADVSVATADGQANPAAPRPAAVDHPAGAADDRRDAVAGQPPTTATAASGGHTATAGVGVADAAAGHNRPGGAVYAQPVATHQPVGTTAPVPAGSQVPAGRTRPPPVPPVASGPATTSQQPAAPTTVDSGRTGAVTAAPRPAGPTATSRSPAVPSAPASSTPPASGQEAGGWRTALSRTGVSGG